MSVLAVLLVAWAQSIVCMSVCLYVLPVVFLYFGVINMSK